MASKWCGARLPTLAASVLLAGCGSFSYLIDPADLDSGKVSKASELVSVQVPAPTEAQKQKTAVIAVHGYSASTYEMSAVAGYLRGKGYLVSNVMLGGHGLDVASFERSRWPDWGGPVKQEYDALRALGYQDVGLVTASTGGSLVLHALATQQLQPPPRRLAMVAPLLNFKNRLIALAGLLQFLGVSNQPNDLGMNSVGNWYHNRPIETLKSLVELTEIVRADLRAGIPLPVTSKALIIQSTGDPTVDPSSAPAIRAGLRGEVTVEMIDSVQHVPVRPVDVDRVWTEQERAQQQDLLGQLDRFLAS